MSIAVSSALPVEVSSGIVIVMAFVVGDVVVVGRLDICLWDKLVNHCSSML